MITIDGAQGGGQIVRTAVSFSALSGRAVRVVNIRGARPNPGLRLQHLLAVRAIGELCAGRVSGAQIGSTEIEFTPGSIEPPASWRLDMAGPRPAGAGMAAEGLAIGSAGSIMLLLQALLPCLAAAQHPVQMVLTGGTNNPWAPPFEYFWLVLLPLLRRMGVHVEAELVARGFYPRGGGEVRLRAEAKLPVKPVALLERGTLERVRGVSYSANLPGHVSQRMARSCRQRLRTAGVAADEFLLDTVTPSVGPGCGIIAIAEFEHTVIAADALGERGKPAEKVGVEAAESLLRDLESGAAVDVHMGDQLVAWVAMAEGESAYLAPRRSDHLVSAVEVARQVMGARFDLRGETPVEVRCKGMRLARQA